MSADGSVELSWADGTYKFRLAIGQLRELQEKCRAGPFAIMSRLRDGTWYVDDVREVIRLGLIGGGMPSTDALVLVVRYVEGQPWQQSVPIAFSILLAALIGIPDEKPSKKDQPPRKKRQGRTGSTSEASTEQAPR